MVARVRLRSSRSPGLSPQEIEFFRHSPPVETNDEKPILRNLFKRNFPDLFYRPFGCWLLDVGIRQFTRCQKRPALFCYSPFKESINGAAMKGANRISPRVWVIGVIVITISIFLAWTRLHQHPATPQLQQSSLPNASTDTGPP